MTRVGLYVPTADGYQSDGTAHTTAQDVAWCVSHGLEWLDVRSLVRAGNSIEVGRNQAVLRAWDAGCTHLRMLDSDVWCPWEQSLVGQLWTQLADPDVLAAAAVVPVRGGKEGKLNVRPVSEAPAYVAQYVSAAAMLIDLQRLAQTPWPAKSPFFRREFNPSMTTCTLDEGYFFSQHAIAGGLKMIACNVDISHGDAHIRRVSRSQD